jgi:hypothetical protein
MGKLLTMMPVAHSAEVAQPIHQRMRARSRILAWLFTAVLWFVTATTAALMLGALFYTGHQVAFGPNGGVLYFGDTSGEVLPPGYVWWSDVALRFRLGGFFAATFQFMPAVLVIDNLRGLFRLYAAGVVFSEENAHRFKWMAIWLIAYAVTPFITVQLLIALDCAIDTMWFHPAAIYAFVLGCVLFVIAQVMEVGRAIEQERDGFV